MPVDFVAEGLGKPAIACRDLVKVYGRGARAHRVLDGVSFSAEPGSLTQVVAGPGVGKTTLLKCLAGREYITDGMLTVEGVEVSRLSTRKAKRLMRQMVAAVLPGDALLPSLDVRANLSLPAELRGTTVPNEQFQRVVEILEIQPLLAQRPRQLSQSENQLVLCARAVLTPTPILIADEPLVLLGPRQAANVQQLLQEEAGNRGRSVITTGAATWPCQGATFLRLARGQLTAEPEDTGEQIRVAEEIALPAKVEEPALSFPGIALSAQQQQVVEMAQQILGSLPGQVAPETGRVSGDTAEG